MILEPLNDLPRISDTAVSFCCYDGPRLSEERHLEPFLRFIRGPAIREDIILVVDDSVPEAFVSAVLETMAVRVFQCNHPFEGHHRHLMRYLTGLLDYEWVIYKGIDTPSDRIDSFRALIAAATALRLNCVIHPSVGPQRPGVPFRIVMGECAMAQAVNRDLVDKALVWDKMADVFHTDEMFLSDWFTHSTEDQPLVWVRYPFASMSALGLSKIVDLLKSNRRFLLYRSLPKPSTTWGMPR